MRKVIVFILIVILIFLLVVAYFSGLLNIFSSALPGQPCGGSTLNAKKCISGYTCKFSFSNCDGCGGICVWDKK